MKIKILNLFVIFLLVFTLVSCQNTNDKSVEVDDTAPIISGTKTLYYLIGDPTPNFLAGVSAFDETDGNVTSSIIVDTKSVNLSIEGIYEFTYYAFDKSGNRAEVTQSINVSGPDLINLVTPTYPSRDFVTKADMATTISIGNPNSSLLVNPPLIDIIYNEAAAQDLTWQTSYNIRLATQNFSRRTTLGFNILGGGVSVYIKLYTVSGLLLIEREIATTVLWREVLIELPETQRHLLNQPLELFVVAPMPRLGGQAGSVQISGIWFEGDKEPAIKLEYDPALYETIYDVNISDLSNQFDGFNDQGIAGNGLVTAVFDAGTGFLTFTNSGYNDWANMAFRIPDKYQNGDNIPLNLVELIVIEIQVSNGAIVKAQNDWSSGDLFEFDGDTDGTVQTWLLPVGPNGYPVWSAIVLAPSYLREGTLSSVVVLRSIKLVRLIPAEAS